MPLTPLDNFYMLQQEPTKSCLLALREIIMAQDKNITASWKYGMPFFCYKGKMFCYLWYHKKFHQPYIGIVEGSHFTEDFLLQEKRCKMKIMLCNAAEDLPIKQIKKILQKALRLYKDGIIKTPLP